MKTLNHQLLRICERSSFRSWCLDLYFATRLYYRVATKKSLSLKVSRQSITQAFASALREINAGLNAAVNSATINARIYTGWLLIGIIAPLSASFYHFFDSELEMISLPYHGNYYYLFHAMSPWIYDAVLCIGIYHLFPSGSKRSYILMVALGWLIAKCLHIYQCTSNEDWHQQADWSLMITGVGISIVFFVSLDWFAWRKFHKFDSIPARIKLILNAPGFSAEQKLAMIENENEKLLTFHKQF